MLNQDTVINNKLYEKFISFFNRLENKTFIFAIFDFSFNTKCIHQLWKTLDWDVNSYLLASQNIDLNNIPYETQWKVSNHYFFIFINFLYYYPKKI